MTSLADLDRQASGLALSPAWRALTADARDLAGRHLRELLDEPGRYAACSRQNGDFTLDFSRQRLTGRTLGLLLDLARERRLSDWIHALFAGEPVNNTEGRPALHMALRASAGDAYRAGDQDILPVIAAERDRMLHLAESIRTGVTRGFTGAPIRHVVNIGIGGSDLGLVMAVEALRSFVTPGLALHFVSNVDGTHLADVLAEADPAETLFVVCSKSFTTIETALNAESARAWIADRLGETAVPAHFVAVSVNDTAMDRFGIAADRRLRIWDWVGGRYSLWSSVGLAIAIAIGADAFRELLAGGRDLDQHFRTADLADNLPVLLGLLAVWNQNHLNVASHAILPYDARLHRFPAYLQQLEMESNGKGVTRDGQAVAASTGTVIWGEPGNNAQHSFFQLLHQGTACFSADFIAPIEGSCPFRGQHLQGLANMLAQAEAFARGHPAEAVRAELAARGTAPAEVARLTPHKAHPGNRVSSIILFSRVTPRALGFLVALYEHKVFVQAAIWGINPFDQWGVELGKKMAEPIHRALSTTGEGLPPVGRLIRDRWKSG